MRGLPAILCCALLALMPVTAVAKKHKALGPVVGVNATGNVTSSPGSSSTATAVCPAKTRVIGGGFFVPPRTPGSEGAVYESFRSSNRGWTASAVALGGAPITVTSYGYCRRTPKPIADVSAAGAVQPGGTGTTSARCRAGSRVVAGGFQSSVGGGGAAYPATSLAASRSTWTLISVSGAPETSAITAHAYCMRGVKAPVFTRARASATLSQFTLLTRDSKACPAPRKPRGKRKKKPRLLLSSGGFSVQPATTSPEIRIFSSAKTPLGWTAAAQNASGPDARATLTSQGICL